MVGLGECAQTNHDDLPSGAEGGYVSLLADDDTYWVGLLSTPEGSRALTAAFLGMGGPDEVTPEDVADAMGELANMLVGNMKPLLSSDDANLTTGLPMFIRGQLNLNTTETLAAHLNVGVIPAWVSVGKQPLSREMRERRDMARALQDREARLRAILDHAAEGIIVVDQDGSIDSLNRAGQRILGYPAAEVIGKKARLLLPDAAIVSDFSGETDGRHRDGRVVPLEITVTEFPIGDRRGLVGIFRDLTARKQSEEERKRIEIELRQAQKLQSVGLLAGGVAHEINTPLQFIGDNLEFLRGALVDLTSFIETCREAQRGLEADEPAVEVAKRIAAAVETSDLDFSVPRLPKALDRVVEGLGRIGEIVSSLKLFASPDRPGWAAIDLNQAIASTLTVAHSRCTPVAEIETDFGDLPLIMCHPGGINQVILNLVLNAADAIARVVKGTDQRGKITIRSRRADDQAVVTVTDTGAGVPEEIQDRIFDPFFTTKDVGQGTGMGLAVARFVVCEEHHGQLTFETEMGRGTTFDLRVPLNGPAARSHTPPTFLE